MRRAPISSGSLRRKADRGRSRRAGVRSSEQIRRLLLCLFVCGGLTLVATTLIAASAFAQDAEGGVPEVQKWGLLAAGLGMAFAAFGGAGKVCAKPLMHSRLSASRNVTQWRVEVGMLRT